MKLPARRGNRLLLLAFSLTLGSGCATLPEQAPVAGGFHLLGKLGIVQGGDSVSARFLWRQSPRRFSIDLWGPLGQGRVNLVGSERRIELRRGDGSVISRGPPEAVMVEHLGWSLPLSVLPEWVRGRPAPGLPVNDPQYDAAGRLAAFEQLDWRVELERYQAVDGGAAEAVEGAELPHRVTASRGAYRIRLVISEWRI